MPVPGWENTCLQMFKLVIAQKLFIYSLYMIFIWKLSEKRPKKQLVNFQETTITELDKSRIWRINKKKETDVPTKSCLGTLKSEQQIVIK